ncbi:MAG TPA: energy transducer TonB, partial [Flavobacteriales bacterium]|nr:energy transducer TonB [Flavobacteriales bacterium]
NTGAENIKGTEEEQLPPPKKEDPPIPDQIFDQAEVQEGAEFPGGQAELMKFLQKNIKYPEMESSSGIQGKVWIEFVVGTDGSINGVKVKRSVSTGLDMEAVRVVKMMPKWKAANNNGKAVKSKYVLPVNFRIAQ